MDIKVEGITLDIMQRALAAAGEGRRHILGEMAKCNPAPRRTLSPYAPRLMQVRRAVPCCDCCCAALCRAVVAAAPRCAVLWLLLHRAVPCRGCPCRLLQRKRLCSAAALLSSAPSLDYAADGAPRQDWGGDWAGRAQPAGH